jgi:hypothetical protein
MRSNTEHIVFTLENSIVMGSHFMSAMNLQRSFYAGLQEHAYGKYSTNAAHLGSEVIVQRVMCHYYEKMNLDRSLKGEGEYTKC